MITAFLRSLRSDGANAAVDECKCGKGREAVELSSKFWDSSNERKYASGTVVILRATSFGFERDWRRALRTHHNTCSVIC